MPTSVMRGGTLHTTWTLYRPVVGGTPTPADVVDPDEFPESPRFELRDDTDTVVDGYDELLYTIRRAKGVYALNLAIPFGDALAPGSSYALHIKSATIDGDAVVDETGTDPYPGVPFTILEDLGADDFSAQRPYADADELETMGISPKPSLKEILFAQGLLDDWMHRPSLWPTIIERERQRVPEDRNIVCLAYGPIIRLCAAQQSGLGATPAVGRYGYGRRDRRALSASASGFPITMAVLGTPPKFNAMDPAQIDFHPITRECWIPTGTFFAPYTEVEITYEAGYRIIPFRVKLALAETIAWVRVKGFGKLTNWSVGRVSHSTGESLITDEVAARLEPDRIKTYA